MVPGLSPLTAFETLVGLDPEPALEEDVFVPYEVVGPYSKRYVVARLFGSTLPFSFALVDPSELAADVVAAGASAVTNVASAPCTVPAELVATSRKWYVLPVVSPLTCAETAFAAVPDAGVGQRRSSCRTTSRCRTRGTTWSARRSGSPCR